MWYLRAVALLFLSSTEHLLTAITPPRQSDAPFMSSQLAPWSNRAVISYGVVSIRSYFELWQSSIRAQKYKVFLGMTKRV